MGACRHKRAGIVSTHAPGETPNADEGHAACNVCARPECIEKAIAWAAGVANRTATYYPDADRSQWRGNVGTPRAERLERYRREHEEAHRG